MSREWTFLTNHAHTLVAIAQNPDARLRDIAQLVGITERAAFRIVGELESAGYLTKRREGRRNVYEIDEAMPLRHPLEQQHTVGALLALVRR